MENKKAEHERVASKAACEAKDIFVAGKSPDDLIEIIKAEPDEAWIGILAAIIIESGSHKSDPDDRRDFSHRAAEVISLYADTRGRDKMTFYPYVKETLSGKITNGCAETIGGFLDQETMETKKLFRMYDMIDELKEEMSDDQPEDKKIDDGFSIDILSDFPDLVYDEEESEEEPRPFRDALIRYMGGEIPLSALKAPLLEISDDMDQVYFEFEWGINLGYWGNEDVWSKKKDVEGEIEKILKFAERMIKRHTDKEFSMSSALSELDALPYYVTNSLKDKYVFVQKGKKRRRNVEEDLQQIF